MLTGIRERKMLHPGDTMTAEERLRAAICLQMPDRVPSAPLIYYFAAEYAGMSNHDLYDPAKYNAAMRRVFEELGGFDAYNWLNVYYPQLIAFSMPMRVLEPGYDLPPDSIRQFLEEEVMEIGDYDWILKICRRFPLLAYPRLFSRWIPRIWEEVGEGWRFYAYLVPRLQTTLLRWRWEFSRWRKRGATVLSACLLEAPFDNFSMARGLMRFARDMRSIPEKIERAADALVESYAFSIKWLCLYTGVKRICLAVHRSSNDFISPADFRKLSFPSLKRLVELLAAEGIASVLHLDGNWDRNLEILRELPAGHVVAEFDGTTDIFKAKEVIGDRICIYGDVPANLLALGSPAEVDEYCHRLIEEVGRGGGFILGTGCELAPNAKPENVRAMLESVTRYGYYRGGSGRAA